MTPEEHIQNWQRLAANLEKVGPGLFLAVKSVQSQQSERIFVNGQASDGSQIGTYEDTKPVYVSDSAGPRAGKHTGKAGNKKKKNGKDYKTTYYQSYEAFRQAQGRESGFVNLRLFGHLQTDFNNAPVQVDNFTFDIKVSDTSFKKARGNEARFGKKIFLPTQDENKTFLRVLNFELNKILFSAK